MTNPSPRADALTLTLRALAHLAGYPDEALRERLLALRDALHARPVLDASRLETLDDLIFELAGATGLDAEAAYVELFDRGRGTALLLFEHVHGDSRDRGPAMIDLIQTYEAAGLQLASDELPDHLSVLLEYASTQPAEAAIALLGEIAHILRALYSALTARHSAYAAIPAALIELAGESLHAVPVPHEPELDDAWHDPAAFGGCTPDGQQRNSNSPQPIRIMRGAAAPSSQPVTNGESV
ncbi:nitrate reductase molybdenum cofactor assembly chaperone [Paraburkholderia phymatum]|uniref:Nitrate reductase molybdenum cofactor assembly chaperone n=1 Tax=Paraburkholderia phymatum (strain DSM 17167 / CIP 108236 / LMG 21445 / STM815) TaxID=391038 RepID=B2JWA6_PARP8|nr:nitrate reductase molybdenum cofactor assembly chaperone [Paraburkholderia phymatum]ACC75233.1 nitrate reductase molybdenum cofactor assembly chaperone [Paraburkholderia phymatum STM815]